MIRIVKITKKMWSKSKGFPGVSNDSATRETGVQAAEVLREEQAADGV